MGEVKHHVWLPEHDAFIRSLWGKRSASKIAEALFKTFKLKNRVSRCAVIGRASRQGLSKLDKNVVRQIVRSEAQQATAFKLGDLVPDRPNPEGVEGVTLLTVKVSQCRWLLNKPGHFVCGAATTGEDSSWCPYHRDIVERPTPRSFNLRKKHFKDEKIIDEDIAVSDPPAAF